MNQSSKSLGQIGGFICTKELVKELQPCITPTVKLGGGSVMMWGGFCQLQSWWLAPGEGQIESYWLLQHTAALCDPICNMAYGSRICIICRIMTKRHIKSKEEQHVLQIMSWLVQSVDLNPIELVWDELDWKVITKQLSSAVHL